MSEKPFAVFIFDLLREDERRSAGHEREQALEMAASQARLDMARQREKEEGELVSWGSASASLEVQLKRTKSDHELWATRVRYIRQARDWFAERFMPQDKAPEVSDGE